MDNTFKCKYPIMLAAMNKVSTLNFAIAAHNSGIFPSISCFNYYRQEDRPRRRIGIENLENDLKIFNQSTGSNEVMLSIELQDLFDENFLNLCTKKIFSHIEVLDETFFIHKTNKFNIESNLSKLQKTFFNIKKGNIKTFYKILTPLQWLDKTEKIHDLFDGAVIKSSDGAGSVRDNESRKPLIDEFKILSNHSPTKVFIPTGGISSGIQIQNFINEGARIVGIGSYFITAEECEISYEAKIKLINASSSDLNKFADTKQNALIFSEIESDDMNHTTSLVKGIKTGKFGHIYVGKGIDNMTQISPLNELVNNLIKDIHF